MSAQGEPSIRQRVHAAVRRYPGIHVRGLERQLAISAPLAQYHLKRLVADGWLEARTQGGYARYYPTNKGDQTEIAGSDQRLLGVLREEVPLHIVLLLLDHGPQPHGAIVERTGLAKSTVSYHLAKMADVGLVDRVAGSVAIRLVDRERVYRLLLAHEPTPDLIETFANLWEDLYG